MEKQIKIGMDEAQNKLKTFINTWKRLENGEKVEVEQRLYFENFEMLFKTLTPQRWHLLKTLRTNGPMDTHALAQISDSSYADTDANVEVLERIGLIDRMPDGDIAAPWDILETHLKLAA